MLINISACNFIKNKLKNSLLTTSISIENPIRHYYPVMQGNTLEVSYRITNTGDAPLLIREIQTSCGCITTNFYSRPIAPGGVGFVNLAFDSDKNIGYVKHYISIIANVDGLEEQEVSFATNIVPSSLHIKDYEEIHQGKSIVKSQRLVDGDISLRYETPEKTE